jgi:hypothetical protein
MIYRNQEVHGYTAISTNLGVTMRLGAGPETSGGYSNRPSGIVECPETEGNSADVDNAVVRCVINWYFDNPTIAAKLFWNKARFFWSPWFGPEANGTMARNPWSQNHPLKSFLQNESGYNLIFGGIGRFISWLWMMGSFLLLLFGFLYLWRLGDLERLLALILGLSFIINLVSSMLTIGDHRFRIPTMALSLSLQAFGCLAIFSRDRTPKTIIDPLVVWPTSNRNMSGKS